VLIAKLDAFAFELPTFLSMAAPCRLRDAAASWATFRWQPK
jgi:hypothetical protein